MNAATETSVVLYELLQYKDFLIHTASFSENVERCNFVTRAGWGGKIYVENHKVDLWQPQLRGVELFNLYYIKPADVVVLSEEQFSDYTYIKNVKKT